MHRPGGFARADVFAGGTEQDVHHAGQHHRPVREQLQLQLRAADDEKEREQRGGPAIGESHQFVGERAEIAEHGAHHHAHQQRGEADGDRTGRELQHRQRNGQKHERNRHDEAVGVGMEQGFKPRQHIAGGSAEQQRDGDFDERVEQHRDQVQRAAEERARHAERYGEHDEAHGVVERDNGQQQIRQGSLCLVLAHDHERGGRGGRRGDGAERDCRGQGKDLRGEQVERDERSVHQQRRRERLHHADDERLPAGLPQRAEPELVANGEGDEPQRDVGHHIERAELRIGGKADARDAEPAEEERADQQPGEQVGRHIRKTERPDEPCHHQPGEQCKRDGQDLFHTKAFLLIPGGYCSTARPGMQTPLFCLRQKIAAGLKGIAPLRRIISEC